jgi:hypothetical protein
MAEEELPVGTARYKMRETATSLEEPNVGLHEKHGRNCGRR